MAHRRARFGVLALALYVPVVSPLARHPGMAPDVGGAGGRLVVVFLGLAVLQDRDALAVPGPRHRASCWCRWRSGWRFRRRRAGGRVRLRRRRAAFGWRQPLGVARRSPRSSFGVFPADDHARRRRLVRPRTPFDDAGRPADPARPARTGDYRVLYVGDPRLIPVPLGGYRRRHRDRRGRRGPLRLPRPVPARRRPTPTSLSDASNEIATGSTQRGGRLLAPYGIRFVVVPDDRRRRLDRRRPDRAARRDCSRRSSEPARSRARRTARRLHPLFENRAGVPGRRPARPAADGGAADSPVTTCSSASISAADAAVRRRATRADGDRRGRRRRGPHRACRSTTTGRCGSVARRSRPGRGSAC